MEDHLKFYIDGKWVDPVTPNGMAGDTPEVSHRRFA